MAPSTHAHKNNNKSTLPGKLKLVISGGWNKGTEYDTLEFDTHPSQVLETKFRSSVRAVQVLNW